MPFIKQVFYSSKRLAVWYFGYNPDYVIGFLRPDNVRGEACPVFTGSVAIVRKSGCLDILAKHRYGEIESSNEVADFEAISARNRLSIAYFAFNY
ncbi:hypothetical protein [Cyclobacterium amurskyense]|uniref:hypothetical protein n=1 Tax=Cyclobacterium amurskyense TaxID=320787 RepID=UPI0030DB7A3E